jgi:transposase
MKNSIRETGSEWKRRPDRTVGIDLGDRFSRYCVLNGDGEVMEEGQVRTSAEGFGRHWEGESRQRIVLETGTHSPWISRLLEGFGHQVIVANARKPRAISQNESKNDRQDAEMLARLGYSDPKLLKPIRHRSVERQRDLNLLRAPRHAGAGAAECIQTSRLARLSRFSHIKQICFRCARRETG